MSAKIIGGVSGNIDCKRMYLPGIIVRLPCKYCGRQLEIDMEKEYLSYPEPRQPTTIVGYCSDCDNGDKEPYTQVQVRLIVELELV